MLYINYITSSGGWLLRNFVELPYRNGSKLKGAAKINNLLALYSILNSLKP